MTPADLRTCSRPSTAITMPVGRIPAGGEEADGEWPVEACLEHVVADGLSECLNKSDLDEVDPGSEADEVGHLAGGDACCDLDDVRFSAVGDDQLREGDPVSKAERVDGGNGDLADGFEVRAWEFGWVEVDPP